jgi:L-lactate permease
MTFAALLPFVILLLCFAGLRLALTTSAFVALIVGTSLTLGLFPAVQNLWTTVLEKTLTLTFEIGFILIGAFFFLETAKRAGTLDSLASLVRNISPNRVVQGILVCFPLTLLVEGSSGFGTPTLVIAPILLALGFELHLCALLPFLICVVGVPYGAMGTPTRLGFGSSAPTIGIFEGMIPVVFLTPLLASRLLSSQWRLRETLWVLSLSAVYAVSGVPIAKTGPELAALGPAFFTFLYGLLSARILFPNPREVRPEWSGLLTYGALLSSMAIGKGLLLDRKFPGTDIRLFNPGMIFIVFALFLYAKIGKEESLRSVLGATFTRAKRTLFVFLCTTLLVQQLRLNGSIGLLTQALPAFLIESGKPLIGFLGSVFVGTSTLSNLLLSAGIDPSGHAALGVGSALGVPLAFQSVVAVRSVLHDRLSEREIYFRILPVSIGLVLLSLLWT